MGARQWRLILFLILTIFFMYIVKFELIKSHSFPVSLISIVSSICMAINCEYGIIINIEKVHFGH